MGAPVSDTSVLFAPVLDQLVQQIGFRLHASILTKVLEAAGESP